MILLFFFYKKNIVFISNFFFNWLIDEDEVKTLEDTLSKMTLFGIIW